MFTYSITLGSSAFPLPFLLVSATDHITGVTGLVPIVAVSKNGGPFLSPAGPVTEIGAGWYVVGGNINDTNTLGPLLLHAEATGADPADALFAVVGVNPQIGTNMGIQALPTGSPGATGGLPVNPISVATVTGSVGSVVAAVTASTVTGSVGSVAGNVTGSVGSVTGSVGSVTSPVTASTVTGNVAGNVTGSVGSVLAPVVAASVAGNVGGSVGSVVDRTGFSLAAGGLNLIDTTPEAGAASTFRGMLIQLFRRFYRPATKSKSTGTIQTFADDGFTILTTQSFSDDGAGNESIGTAS
jgi:hypothetical protein